MIEVPLTRGMVAVIDDEDRDNIAQYRWRAIRGTHTWYAVARFRRPDRTLADVCMHRLIMSASSGDAEIDHIDLDGLNNRKYNLRPASRAQQMRNTGLRSTNKSGFKGVCRRKTKWKAQIMCDYRHYNIGYFDTPEEAARAYDAKAVELFGEFARLNFPQEGMTQSGS